MSARESLIVQTSQVGSVSICPFAEVVNAVDVATGAPPPTGSVARSQPETLFRLLPLNDRGAVVTSYQKEYLGVPDGAQPIAVMFGAI